MKVHFIAIGGSAMHNLAIALHKKGYIVTGSDDEIFEPSRSRLAKYGLLPPEEGWFPGRITPGLDAVVLGMHAKEDNPELQEVKKLDIPVYSYPEYLYEQSKNKTRVVIGGSHGKTTITAMVLHVLYSLGKEVDYMVGAQLDGFDIMVKLSEESPVVVLEGDEYLSSPLDRRPKFHLYKPDIALLSGIAWDHINVFPTFESYLEQFRIFLDKIVPGGTLVYCREDEIVNEIVEEKKRHFRAVPYGTLDYFVEGDRVFVNFNGEGYPLKIFGRHNMQNLDGARMVCRELGISDGEFFKVIGDFEGASKRLQHIASRGSLDVYKDFAHSPSKLRATVDAVRERYPGRKLVACIELHTYSSLSSSFLEEYKGCMENADIPVVYFDPHALELKRLPALSREDVVRSFGQQGVIVFNESEELRDFLLQTDWKNSVLLMMSSGNFGGLDPEEIASELT